MKITIAIAIMLYHSFPTLLQGYGSNHILVHSLKQVAQHVTHRNAHGMHTNTALSACIRVQQRTLNGEGRHIQHTLQGELQHDRGIRVTNRHRHQV